MVSIRTKSNEAWEGKLGNELNVNKFITNTIEEFSKGLAFIATFANVIVIDTTEGLVLVDSGAEIFSKIIFSVIRKYSKKPVIMVIFTHGHIDHVSGVKLFDEEAEKNTWKKPQVLAHKNLIRRFDRYRITLGYNEKINTRQFGVNVLFSSSYRYPDQIFTEEKYVTFGDLELHIFHALGETDDAAWVWIPKHKAICTGDLFIWCVPNCGNPQKVQRYPREWAIALRKMDLLKAEILFPGHGPPILGFDRIHQALVETASFLEDIFQQALTLMNSGATLSKILETYKVDKVLLTRPYLQPIYDEPDFIVRNIWRLYGGWYDGNPANLKPAKDDIIAKEIVSAYGGALDLANRAHLLISTSPPRFDVACHLIEHAVNAEPENSCVHKIRSEIYHARALQERSLMAKGIFNSAAKESAILSQSKNSKL